MISKELNDWLQLVGLFGVLGGLIFVGLELRLARQVAMTDAAATALEAQVSLFDFISQHPDVWVKGAAGEPLTEIEQTLFDGMARIYSLRQFTGYDRAVRMGRLPAVRMVRETAYVLHNNPGLRAWWIDRQELLDQWDANPGEAENWPEGITAELERLDRETSEH